MVFWNVARLRGKDREFWRSLGKWEVVVLMETWRRRDGKNERIDCRRALSGECSTRGEKTEREEQ